MQIAYSMEHTVADRPENVLSVQILLFRLSVFPELPLLNPDCIFSRCNTNPFFYLHMHELRNHLKRNHFIVRCKLCLRSYLGALCQGTELVVCLLLPTNKHHVNTNAQIFDMTNTWCQDLENPLARLTEIFLQFHINKSDSLCLCVKSSYGWSNLCVIVPKEDFLSQGWG